MEENLLDVHMTLVIDAIEKTISRDCNVVDVISIVDELNWLAEERGQPRLSVEYATGLVNAAISLKVCPGTKEKLEKVLELLEQFRVDSDSP